MGAAILPTMGHRHRKLYISIDQQGLMSDDQL